MYERFTDRARKVMQLANQEAQRFHHEYIGTEHMLLGIIKEGSGVASNVLRNLGLDLGTVRREVEKIVQTGPGGDQVVLGRLPHTPRAKKVIEYSVEEARNLNHNYFGTEHLLLGLLREQEGVAAQVLMNLGLKLEGVREETLNLLGRPLPDDPEPRPKVISPKSKTPTLDTLGNDLNDFARTGKLDKLSGRQAELTAVFEVFACRSRTNIVLLGQPGVGRSTLVGGLVHAIVEGRAPAWLWDRRVVLIPISRLWADGHSGKVVSEQTRAVFNEVRRSKNTILFLPDAVASLGIAAGGPAAECVHVQLLAALWTEQVPCILTATPAEYQRCLQRRPALAGSLQEIAIRPTTIEETIAILQAVRDRYEAHHQVGIIDEALSAAAEVAGALPGVLPGKAVILLDRAAARARMRASGLPSDIAAAVRDLDVRIERLNREKEDFVAAHDFERAAERRNQADALQQEKKRLLEGAEVQGAVQSMVDAALIAEVARDLAGDAPTTTP